MAHMEYDHSFLLGMILLMDEILHHLGVPNYCNS